MPYPRDLRLVHVAVAIALDDRQRVLWIWNDRWGCFCLPMSKLRRYPGVPEPADHAALRAAAEALGVPVILGKPFEGTPTLEVSQGDGEAKSYQHIAFPTLPHPAFADKLQLPRGHLWLTAHDALKGDLKPLSENSLALIAALVDQRNLPAGK